MPRLRAGTSKSRASTGHRDVEGDMIFYYFRCKLTPHGSDRVSFEDKISKLQEQKRTAPSTSTFTTYRTYEYSPYYKNYKYQKYYCLYCITGANSRI